ncbi:MAG: protein kinase domain-containing protein [Fimbriiglobus sp.]
MTSSPITTEKFLELLKRSGVVTEGVIQEFTEHPPFMASAQAMASALIKAGHLTTFQAKLLLAGKHRGLVLGNYKLLDQIGRGGMGTVYLAEHTSLKRRAAVKVLASDQATTTIGTERFYREAQSAAALDHPNIVKVYDVGQFGNVHYIAMEYVDGQTLAQLIDKNGPLHFATAADYIAQAAAGLQEAGDKGFVHRDIKPENLIVDKLGVVKILDMGLTRHADDEGGSRLTAVIDPNSVVGTPDYIAPEQALNLPVDIRTDIYSLGVTFFALLTGKPPFTGTTAQKLLQHQLKEAPSLGAIKAKAPPEIEPIVAMMMAKKPEDRFQQPAEIIESLAPWLSPSAITGQTKTVSASRTRITSRVQMAPPPKAKPKWLLPAIAAAVMVVAIGGGAAIYSVMSGTDKPTTMTSATTTKPTDTGSNTSTTPPVTPPATTPKNNPNELPALAPGVLLVANEGPEPRFASITEALATIKPGEKKVIVVRNAVHSEQLSITSKHAGVTIESGFPKNLVTWTPPSGATDKPLLEINGAEGVRFRGFKFDGQNRVSDTIKVTGRCPDATIEECHALGFTHAAIALYGANGAEDRLVTVKKFRTTGGGESALGVSFEPGTAHNYVRIMDSRFEGPLGAAVQISGPVMKSEVRRNRIFRTSAAIRYKPINNAVIPLGLSVRNNTIVDVALGLDFAAIPPNLEADAQALLIQDNLFQNVSRMALVNGASLTPDTVPAWFWFPEFEKTTVIPADQPRYFRKTFNVAAKPTGTAWLNVGVDENFIVWVNGKEIGKSATMNFSQRVYAFDITKELVAGPNTIAIQATNDKDPLDPKFGTAAALTAQLVEINAGQAKEVLAIDDSWKCSKLKVEGWLESSFDDKSWVAVKQWTNTTANMPWRETIWDSAVDASLKGQAKKFKFTFGGNVRDYFSMEGFPVLESKRTTMTGAMNRSLLPTDPEDDATFLRYLEGSRWNTGGVTQGPVGVPPAGY